MCVRIALIALVFFFSNISCKLDHIGMSIEDIITDLGYVVETHKVMTAD